MPILKDETHLMNEVSRIEGLKVNNVIKDCGVNSALCLACFTVNNKVALNTCGGVISALIHLWCNYLPHLS